MARTADFRLDSGFYFHPKIRRLQAALGAEGVLSWILLLAYASLYKTDGRFAGMSDEEIALAAHWTGDASEFIRTLVELRLLDRRGKTLSLHDWSQHNGYAASYIVRSERAKKAAETRWGQKRGDAQPNGGQSGSNAQASDLSEHSLGNAPSPEPDPSPKEAAVGAASPNGKRGKVRKPEVQWPYGDESSPPPDWWTDRANELNLNSAKEWRSWRGDMLAHDKIYADWKQASLNRLARRVEQQPAVNGSANGAAPSAKPLALVRKELGLQ